MNIMSASKLTELYAACPKCGCEVIGNGKGTLECDTGAGYFKRACGCGWFVEVQEGTVTLGDPTPAESVGTPINFEKEW